MSNLPQQNTVNQYIADGATTIFIYSYLILLETDLLVYLTPPNTTPDPAADIQVLNVDYTVQGVGTESGGTITFTNTPASNSIVTIVRNIQASIDTQYDQARNINGQNLDDDFGRITLVSQQISTNFGTFGLQYTPSSVGYNESNGINPLSNIVPRLLDNQIWVGQSGGIIAATLEQNPDVSVLRSQLASQANGSDGTTIIGYYDTFNSAPGTLNKFLNDLYPNIVTITQQNAFNFAIDSGTANHIVVSPAKAYAYPYSTGTTINFIASNPNTGATDIAISGNAVANLMIQGATGLVALPAFYIRSGVPYSATFVGSNNFVLNNPQKPTIIASAYMSASQVITASTSNVLVNFDSVRYDPFSLINTTNHTITLAATGYYNVTVSFDISQTPLNGSLFINGVSTLLLFEAPNIPSGFDASISPVRKYFATAGDILSINVTNPGGSNSTIGTTLSITAFEIEYLGV